MTQFYPSAKQPFTVAVRGLGGAVEETEHSNGDPVQIFLPPYSGKGEKAISVLKALDNALAALKAAPAPGKVPTYPLTYGGWMRYGEDNDLGRKYAQLYVALGMRSINVLPDPATKILDNLKAAGLDPNRSLAYMEYRFPPTDENIAKTKDLAQKAGLLDKFRWYPYGDEIAFSEWVSYLIEAKKKELNNPKLTNDDVLRPMWQDWLKRNRPGFKPADYWRAAWGAADAAQLRPDSSAAAAAEKPHLYVDSLIFYEDASIGYVASRVKAVKAALGEHVLCGANYSAYPFYYPSSVMYVKWFRDGAAQYGCHSEYFWQLGQVTPMVNGYIAEHFRAGMRFDPKAINRQYSMPHSPGNTDGDFRRTCFSHVAHGAKNLDYFGIAMNEYTENYIDFRDTARYVAIRDVNYSLATVEDVLEESQAVPTEVGLLVSESTERWDHAGIAMDLAQHDFGPGFRKDRLSFHQDRVGLFTALTFAGASPDLLIERDLTPAILKGYKVVYLVGDSIPASVVPVIEAWVKDGGVVFATAGVGRFGAYRESNPELQKFLGLAERKLEERDIFMRTSQEVPFLKPLGAVKFRDAQFPALGTFERITPLADTAPVATFQEDGSSAVIVRLLGKGRIYYTAALPGLSYLYTGLTTPKVWVADRGPGVHRSVTTYDKLAAQLIALPLAAAGIEPRVKTDPDYIDTRLLRAKGVFILPLANYNQQVGQPVTVTIRPPADAGKPTEALSAFSGKLPIKVENGTWTFTIPKLGYGDIVRINAP